MDPQELIKAIQDLINVEFYTLILDVILAGVILFLLKFLTESLANYILFRLDKYLAIGSAIEIYGKTGRIKIVSFFNITIETSDGHIRVPTRHWRASRYILLKEVPLIKNRRKDD